MEEGPSAMDVEHPSPSHGTPPPASSSPSNRFGLVNSVQTNFGNDYVFQISSRFDWSLMGVSLSSNMVKLYSPSTGQCCGVCRGHTDSINHISFSGPSSPHLIVSSSSDWTVQGWGTRSFKEVSRISASPSQEIFSFSFEVRATIFFLPDANLRFWFSQYFALLCIFFYLWGIFCPLIFSA